MSPYLPPRHCNQAGCGELVQRGEGRGYCPAHVNPLVA